MGGKNLIVTQSGSAMGYTRTDLVFTMGIAVLLGALLWAGMAVAGEKRRIFFCAHHLKTLGGAFAEYAHDHHDTLPPAVISDGTNSTSWDREIASYLNMELRKPVAPEARKVLEAKIAPLFKCPSDREPHGDSYGRSYAMPAYDLNRLGWPPGKDSAGGLGLNLDADTLKKARESEGVDSPDYLPAIKTSIISAPTDTALLVERISILNALWAGKYACIASTKEQFDAKTFTARDFHNGKMNYLMADGHVELMSEAQSTGFIGGVWTIRKGD